MKILLYICFALFMSSCNSQDKKEDTKATQTPTSIKHNTMNQKNNYANLINDKIEHFNIKKYYENNPDGLGKTYEDKGAQIEESSGEGGGWFITDSTPKNSIFSIYKEFNDKGIILKKWVNFRNGGGPVGIKYEYDDSGKLIKRTDMDKDFKITPNDIIDYCKKHEIDLFSYYTSIDRFIDEKTKKGVYFIGYRGKYEGEYGARITILLDGNTGEIQKVTRTKSKYNGSLDILYEKK